MNAKRIFSIVIAIVLTISCMSFSASAENSTVTISLKGEDHAIVGAEYKVHLNVSESAADIVGGLSCDIIYNTEKFALKRAELTSSFATANYIAADGYSDLIRDNAGKVSVMLLGVDGDKAQNKWITLVFEVLSTDGTANFVLDNASVSDAVGKTFIESDLVVDITDEEIEIFTPQTTVNGASIKKDVKDENGNIVGNIRFEAQIGDIIDERAVEVGFVMLPTACLDNGELTITESGKYTMANGREVSIAYNGKAISSLNSADNRYYCYLTNTMDFPLTMSFSARAYVKLNDGSYIYGYNEIVDNNITSGTSSRSCIDIAKAIYNEYKTKYSTYDFSAIEEIVALEASKWTNENYQTVVNTLVAAENSAS